MAITKTWTIETLERDITDGYVLNVFWVLTGKNGNEIINQQKGKVEFIKPSSLPSEFINYDDLDETSVITWVKNALGTEMIAELEKIIILKTEYGKPF